MKAPGAFKNVTSFHIYPSILFWNDPRNHPISSFDFGSAFTEGMQLDAKIASPTDTMISLRADTDGWMPLGLLEEEKVNVTENQKQAYKQKLQDNADRAAAKRLEVKVAVENRKMHPFLAWLTGVSHA